MNPLVNRLALARTGGRLQSVVPIRSAGATIEPTVTAVIPCYNYGHYLPACVSAVLDQPGVRADVIIVDDCSPDGSADIASKLAADDSRVTVIRHLVNKGHIATYNDGLDAATGEFVTLVSADDLVTPGALTRAAALLVANPSVGFAYGNAIHFSADPPPRPRTDAAGWVIWSGATWLAQRCRSGYNVIASPEVVMRTDVLRRVGGYRTDLPHSGDFEMWMRAASVADVGFILGADQALYRQHATNMHKSMFKSGNFEGTYIDLRQRWAAFEAVFEGPGQHVRDSAALIATARRTLAVEALESANYAFARGFQGFPVEQFEKLALEVDPTSLQSGAGRALARRKARGISRLPVHPLWAPRSAAQRGLGVVHKWRRARVGV